MRARIPTISSPGEGRLKLLFILATFVVYYSLHRRVCDWQTSTLVFFLIYLLVLAISYKLKKFYPVGIYVVFIYWFYEGESTLAHSPTPTSNYALYMLEPPGPSRSLPTRQWLDEVNVKYNLTLKYFSK